MTPDVGEGDDSPSRSSPDRDPFVRRLTTAVTVVVVSALLLALFILGVKVILAAFGGVLLAILLRAGADFVHRSTRLPAGWSLAAVVVGIVALLALAGLLLAPSVADQVQELRERLPQLTAEIERVLGRSRIGRLILDRASLDGESGEDDGELGPALSALSRGSSYILVALMVGLFGAANPRLYRDALVNMLPVRHRQAVHVLFDDLGQTLRWWLIGQGLAMIVIGVSTTLVLLLFGVPLAIPLGIIVGLLGFVPYLGPLIGAVPVALIAATQGTQILVYVLVAYTAVQLLEGYVATPLIQHRTVYLPPAFTVIAEILFGVALGVMGFIFATPIAAAALPVVRFYRREILGERDVQARR